MFDVRLGSVGGFAVAGNTTRLEKGRLLMATDDPVKWQEEEDAKLEKQLELDDAAERAERRAKQRKRLRGFRLSLQRNVSLDGSGPNIPKPRKIPKADEFGEIDVFLLWHRGARIAFVSWGDLADEIRSNSIEFPDPEERPDRYRVLWMFADRKLIEAMKEFEGY